jgi:hypothetical protein
VNNASRKWGSHKSKSEGGARVERINEGSYVPEWRMTDAIEEVSTSPAGMLI